MTATPAMAQEQNEQEWVVGYEFAAGSYFTNTYYHNAYLMPSGPVECVKHYLLDSWDYDVYWKDVEDDTLHTQPANQVTVFANDILRGYTYIEKWTDVTFLLYKYDTSANEWKCVSRAKPTAHSAMPLPGGSTEFTIWDFDAKGEVVQTRKKVSGLIDLRDNVNGYNGEELPEGPEAMRWTDDYFLAAVNPDNDNEVYEYSPAMSSPCTKLNIHSDASLSAPYKRIENKDTLTLRSYMVDLTLTCDIPNINGKQNDFKFYRVWRVEPDGTETLLNEQPNESGKNWEKKYSDLYRQRGEQGKSVVEIKDLVVDNAIKQGETYELTYIVRLYEHCNNMSHYLVNKSSVNANAQGSHSFKTHYARYDADGIIERRLTIPFNADTPTALEEVATDAQPIEVTYYNLMGAASSKPFAGVNIVVTRYDNGTMQRTKQIF